MGSFSKIKTAPSGTFTKISTGEIIKPQSVERQSSVRSSFQNEPLTPTGGTERQALGSMANSAVDAAVWSILTGRTSSTPSTDIWARGSRYSGANSSGLREAQEDRLRKLEGRRSELTAGLDLEGASALDNDINSLRKKLVRTLPQQTVRTAVGMAKAIPAGLEGAAGSMANAWTAFYQGGQGGRDVQNREYLQEYTDGLEQSRRRLDAMLRDNARAPGTWGDGDIQSQQNIVDDWQRKYDAMSKVVGEDIQRQATRESYGVSDTLSADSARRLEDAKQGVAAPGRVLIDATGSLIQNAADLGVNAFLGTPGSMGTFAMRAFGGGAQQARQEMEAMGTADQEGAFEKQLAYGLASMTKEIATEKMFGLSAPFGAAYGKGSLDDLAQDAVNRAVSRFAKTSAGKRALERGLNFVNSAASEGLEELIGDWMEWQLPRIYGGEVDTAQEVLENSIYDFLVGAASGGLGDVTYRGAGSALNAVTGNTARSTGAQFREMGEDVVQATIDEGLSSAAGTISNTMAQELQSKLDRGETVTDREIGRLYQANVEAIEAENAAKQHVQQEKQTEQAPAVTQAAQEAAQTQTNEMTRQATQGRTEAQRALDAARVERASSALGENGKKALNATYNGQAGAQEYYGGFSAYYQAGVSGQDINKVRSEYSGALTPAQRFAAYTSGQNDAALSLAREKEAARFAPVAGDKSGLVYDDFVRQAVESGRTAQDVNQETRTYLTAETAERVNTLAKDLGVRVRFVPKDSIDGGIANAKISGSEIVVEQNNENPVMAIVGHELTHRMQELAPEAYRQFRDIVMQEDGQSNRVQQRIADYSRQGVTLDTEAAMDEVAADYAGRMMDDGNVLDDFIKKHHDDRTLLEKLRDAFRALWQKLTGREKRQAGEAEKKLTAALEAAAAQAEQNRQNAAQEEGSEKTSYSLKEYSKEQLEDWSDSKSIVIYKDQAQLRRFIQNAMDGHNLGKKLYFGAIPADLAARINADTGIDVEGYNLSLGANEIRKIFKDHGNEQTENLRGQRAITAKDIMSIQNIIQSPDEIRLSKNLYNGKPAIEFVKTVDGRTTVVSYVSNKHKDLIVQTMYSGKIKKGLATPTGEQAPVNTPKASSGTAFEESVAQGGEDVKPRYSLKATDSQGRELTKEQRKFFMDSKVVDDQGRLLVMYHGTNADKQFTVFNTYGGKFGLFGTGSYFTDSREVAVSYAENKGKGQSPRVYETYLNIKNPLDMDAYFDVSMWAGIPPEVLDAVRGAETNEDFFRKLKEYCEDNEMLKWEAEEFIRDIIETGGFDGITHIGGGRYGSKNGPKHRVFIALEPEQIKNVTNKKPTGDPDIRYSLKEGTISKSYEALLRENDALRERVDYWKGQTRRTQRITTDKKAVEQAARALIRDYGAQIGLDDIRGDLQSLYDYISSGYEGKNELTYTEARRRAENIARTLVENAVAVDDTLYQDYQDLRKHLRNVKLTISEADSQGLTDYNDFRKRNFGRLNLGKGRTNIDQVYKELSEMWPGLFNEQEYNNPADQLYHIAEVLDTVSATQEYNPFSGDMRNAVAGAANEIMERFFDIPQTRATFADKQAAKLDKLRAENRGKVQKAIARERGVRERQLQRLKDHYAQVRQNRAERRADSEARSRLLKIAKRLQNKKLPAVSRALLDQYIGDLDTTAKNMTGRTLERLSELKDWYAEQKENDPDFIADPAIEKELDRLSKRHIGDMTAEEVADLTRVLLNIENELRTKRHLIDSEDRRDVYLQGVQVINDIENSGGNKEGGVMGAVDKYIVTETLSPLRQIKRMAGYTKDDPLIKLTNALADGQRASLSYQMEAEKPFQKWAENKKFSRDFSGDKAQTITITGLVAGKGPTTVEITPAMRASLYLHSLNDQNLRHIRDGGITVPDMKLYKQGKIAEAYARGTTIKLTPSQVRSITANMTMEEKAFAKAVHDYFNGQSRDRINEVSEKLKGYSIAQVENYFPINTDTSFTKSDFETLKFDGTLEGMGFLKERQAKAANPIYLRDVNDVLQKSIDQHSKYVGLAIPVRNFNKVWGVTKSSFNDDGSRNSYEGSVQKAVKKAWGESGYNYVEKMMTDLQGGGNQKNVWTRALNKIRSNYAGAVLTLNASVAMKQAASYPTAAAVLGWGPLARAMADTGRVNLDLIAKYTPLQWYRSKGFSTKELGDLRQSGGPIAKVMNNLPPALNWVQGADLLTTRKLWKASEYYVKAHNKELSPGTDAYYRAVADIYNRVIEETQPNYTTMQRPQLLRSDDTLLGNLAMFKTQPFQNFNILYDAVGEYIAAKKNGTDIQTARRNLGNAVTSQLAQLAVFAGMTMAWALFRGRREKYEDEEGEMSLQSVAYALGKDMIGGQLSTVPFGSDAWELVSSKLFGDQYYGMDAVTVTAISDTIGSLNGMGELIGSTLKSVAAGEDVNWDSTRIKLDGYMDDISKAAGVPYENVVNLFNAGYRHTCIAALGKYQGEYAALKLTADPEKKSSTYYDLLYKAMKQAPNQYDAIYRDMVNSGHFPADKISSAMETRMKNDQGVEKVSELEQRYLPPEQEREYSRMQKKVSGTRVWRSATAEQRSAAEEDLYNIVSGNKSGEKLTEKISAGAPYGVDETDYILYRLALRIADQPTESGKIGTYTNEEVEEAINMLSGLSNNARGYLWEAQGRSEKSNPYA